MSSKYIVPASDRREFDRMVQRANRRINANLKFIQIENIKSESAQRALMSDYADRSNWHTPKTAFSRSIKFDSKKAYEQYKRHVMQWGGKNAERTVEGLKAGYEKAIIKSLTTAAIDNNIPLDNGRLPGNIRQKIKGLSLEQMTHFFHNDEPVADMEYLPYSEVDFNGVDEQGFIDNVDTIINSLEQIYPNANERKYREMIANGMDAKAALKTIFPKATPGQLRYYTSKNGKIPEFYKPPRNASSKKGRSRKRRKK